MKSKLFYSLILAAGLMFMNFSASQVYGQQEPNKLVKPQTVWYTCPMHPEVVQDHPGKCPKCGMELVVKKDLPSENKNLGKDSPKMNTEPILPDTTNTKKEPVMKNNKPEPDDPEDSK